MEKKITGYFVEYNNAGDLRGFMDANGTVIEIEDRKFYYLPFYLEVAEGGFMLHHLNSLPSELIMAIGIHREAKDEGKCPKVFRSEDCE